jgi:hypothetical protein
VLPFRLDEAAQEQGRPVGMVPLTANTRTRRGRGGRRRSVGAQALGAAALLAFLIFVLSKIPDTRPGYDRDGLARFMCETVAVNPESAQCVGVTIGSWFLIVVAAGILLQIGRTALRAVGLGRGSRD